MTQGPFRKQIEDALAPLIGLPLWDSGRAADLAWFALGERRTVKDFRGNPKEVGEYALHVQCAWRITQDDKVLVGRSDLYYPAGYSPEQDEIPDDFNWDVQGANRQDELIRDLFQGGGNQFRVLGVEVGPAASFNIALERNLSLQVFPQDSSSHEYWRLFRPYRDEPHFVVSSRGIESE